MSLGFSYEDIIERCQEVVREGDRQGRVKLSQIVDVDSPREQGEGGISFRKVRQNVRRVVASVVSDRETEPDRYTVPVIGGRNYNTSGGKTYNQNSHLNNIFCSLFCTILSQFTQSFIVLH